MMRSRTFGAVVLIVLLAVILETTLFGRIRFITPDLVLLVAILLALTRIRPELVLLTGFLAGLTVDLLGSSLLGLRAMVFTSAAYVAIRSRDRAEIGRIATALWAGVISLIALVALILVGTLFGQSSILGEEVFSRVLLVPLANVIVAFAIAPTIVRLVDHDPAALRYS
jgi:rod shape-determining protein MreD